MAKAQLTVWLESLIEPTPEFKALKPREVSALTPQDAFGARAHALGLSAKGSYWTMASLRSKASLNEYQYQLYALHLVQNFGLTASGVLPYVDAYLSAVELLNEKRAAHTVYPLPTADSIRGIVEVSNVLTDEGIILPYEVLATAYTHLTDPLEFLTYLRQGREPKDAARLLRIAYSDENAEPTDFMDVPEEWMDLLFSENPDDWKLDDE